jgi:two-component system, OmpR family, phosphate regulon response regulator PhoB
MAKLLVVDDEDDIRQVLQFALEAHGHEVFAAASATQALATISAQSVDLVLLDLMLPDAPGTDVCRSLRASEKHKYTGIIMLTARGSEQDRILGFELGADDYVVKPFSNRELLLRVDAVLRRYGPREHLSRSGGEQTNQTVVFGVLRLDPFAHRAWVNDNEVELTALEFRLLATLHERRDRVQSRSVLLKDVWGIEAEIHTRTVDTHVKRLREKLGPAGDYVETVRGVGYRFAATPNKTPSGDPGSLGQHSSTE